MAEKKKTVKIKLFKDYGEYRDDVFVAVNGESYLIPVSYTHLPVKQLENSVFLFPEKLQPGEQLVQRLCAL